MTDAPLITIRRPTRLPVLASERILPMSDVAIDNVRLLTEKVLQLPQYEFITDHVIHGGVYTRRVTVRRPAGADVVVCTGALVKIPTTLILIGEALAYLGDKTIPVSGIKVCPASAHRKQAFVVYSELTMIMYFKTDAKTVAEAEAEFTDEAEKLWPLSDIDRHTIIVTGE